jgi:formamidopyrimidine-DNA glycosylase
MPEGPEVRHNADLLSRLTLGHRIDELRPVSGKLQRTGLTGAASFKPSIIKSVTAHGKLIVIRFLDGSALTSTLGMSGWWYPSLQQAAKLYDADMAYQSGKLVLAQDVVRHALKYSRVELISNGQPLAVFTDMRNFGNMEYHPQGLSASKIAERIGLDLLNELPAKLDNPEQAKHHLLVLKDRASKRLLNMKMGDVALEQCFIAGLGNIYRAETFWLTGIDPHAQLKSLDPADWLMFCEVGMVVLQIAYATAGVMHYPAAFIEGCTGKSSGAHRGHLAYGRTADIFGRPIIRDGSFGRALWRLETI